MKDKASIARTRKRELLASGDYVQPATIPVKLYEDLKILDVKSRGKNLSDLTTEALERYLDPTKQASYVWGAKLQEVKTSADTTERRLERLQASIDRLAQSQQHDRLQLEAICDEFGVARVAGVRVANTKMTPADEGAAAALAKVVEAQPEPTPEPEPEAEKTIDDYPLYKRAGELVRAALERTSLSQKSLAKIITNDPRWIAPSTGQAAAELSHASISALKLGSLDRRPAGLFPHVRESRCQNVIDILEGLI